MGSDDEGTRASSDPMDPLDPWGWWILRWFGAMLATVAVAGSLFVATREGPRAALWLVIGSTIIVLAVGAMTLVAAVLRLLLVRYAPHRLRRAIVPVVLLGAVSGPLVVFSSLALEDPQVLTAPTRANLGIVLAGPLVLGGGFASYLAERQVSPRRPGWWLAVAAAASIGLLLFAP